MSELGGGKIGKCCKAKNVYALERFKERKCLKLEMKGTNKKVLELKGVKSDKASELGRARISMCSNWKTPGLINISQWKNARIGNARIRLRGKVSEFFPFEIVIKYLK